MVAINKPWRAAVRASELDELKIGKRGDIKRPYSHKSASLSWEGDQLTRRIRFSSESAADPENALGPFARY